MRLKIVLIFCLVWPKVSGGASDGCSAPLATKSSFPTNYSDSFELGKSIIFKCLPGRQMKGSPNTVTCLPNATWSKPKFYCELLDCGFPNEPKYGSVLYSTTTFGSHAQYECNKGYKLILPDDDDNVRHCMLHSDDNGNDFVKWFGIVPTCEVVKCPQPPYIKDGTFTDFGISYYTYLTKLQYSCNDGYKFVSASTGIAYCNENGSWDSVPPCRVDYNCDFTRYSSNCGYTNQNWKRTFSFKDCLGRPSYVAQAIRGERSVLISKPYNVSLQGACLHFCHRILSAGSDSLQVVILAQEKKNRIVFTAKESENWARESINLNPGVIRWMFKINSPQNRFQIDTIELEEAACEGITPTTRERYVTATTTNFSKIPLTTKSTGFLSLTTDSHTNPNGKHATSAASYPYTFSRLKTSAKSVLETKTGLISRLLTKRLKWGMDVVTTTAIRKEATNSATGSTVTSSSGGSSTAGSTATSTSYSMRNTSINEGTNGKLAMELNRAYVNGGQRLVTTDAATSYLNIGDSLTDNLNDSGGNGDATKLESTISVIICSLTGTFLFLY